MVESLPATLIIAAFSAGAGWAGARVGVKAQLNGTAAKVDKVDKEVTLLRNDMVDLKVGVASLRTAIRSHVGPVLD